MCVHNTNYTSIAIQPDQDTDPNLWLQWTCIFFIDCSHVVNSQFIQAYPKPKLLNLSRRITYFAKPWLKIGPFRMAPTNHPSPYNVGPPSDVSWFRFAPPAKPECRKKTRWTILV